MEERKIAITYKEVEAYERGFREGFNKCLDLVHKELELARLHRPIQFVVNDTIAAERAAGGRRE